MTYLPAKPFPLLMVRKYVQRIASAERDRDDSIREAFGARKDHGYHVDDIAEAAGLSRQRIYQIVKEADDGV